MQVAYASSKYGCRAEFVGAHRAGLWRSLVDVDMATFDLVRVAPHAASELRVGDRQGLASVNFWGGLPSRLNGVSPMAQGAGDGPILFGVGGRQVK